MLYLISDTHFCEQRIEELFYANDFFKSVNMYEGYLKTRWRTKVKPDDDVIVVGDAGQPSAFEDLPGKITLVRGNHDTYPESAYNIFYTVADNLTFEVDGISIVIEHIPLSTKKKADIRICGHAHYMESYMYITEQDTKIFLMPNLLGYEPRTLTELLDDKYHQWSFEFMNIRNSVLG